MKRHIQCFAILGTLLLLSGCGMKGYALDDNENISADARVCKRLKRQMVYNIGNPNTSAKLTTQSQIDRLHQLYVEYDCNNVLAGKPSAVPSKA